jgi:aldehyde:ferredoxin oxidoreductase
LQADAGRGVLVTESEDFAAVLDSLIVCKFLRKCFADFYPEAATLLSCITGWAVSEQELRRVGERIVTLKKLFNIREGWRPQDDWLPPRLLSEKLPTGVVQGVGLTPDELHQMIDSYYQARGWERDGTISQHKLEELHLDRTGG